MFSPSASSLVQRTGRLLVTQRDARDDAEEVRIGQGWSGFDIRPDES